ncbi:MAG: hypothetical protein U1C97_02670 [Candidatus Gracilibacteria bacterium]|nr:hypothetical protein [bacterium]MDZ4217198.1 hypothetical protein [Candidatus Gracilibacteria bacterium]
MKAFSTLIGVIFLLAFLSVITAGMSFMSISNLKSNYYLTQSHTTSQQSEACIDEVLRRLRDDLNYGGGSVPLTGDTSCTAVITGDDTDKTITSTVSNADFEHSITASIQIFTNGEATNFRITDWTEN